MHANYIWIHTFPKQHFRCWNSSFNDFSDLINAEKFWIKADIAGINNIFIERMARRTKSRQFCSFVCYGIPNKPSDRSKPPLCNKPRSCYWVPAGCCPSARSKLIIFFWFMLCIFWHRYVCQLLGDLKNNESNRSGNWRANVNLKLSKDKLIG